MWPRRAPRQRFSRGKRLQLFVSSHCSVTQAPSFRSALNLEEAQVLRVQPMCFRQRMQWNFRRVRRERCRSPNRTAIRTAIQTGAVYVGVRGIGAAGTARRAKGFRLCQKEYRAARRTRWLVNDVICA